jgi:hypothetical protein
MHCSFTAVGYEIPDAVLAQNPNDHPCKKLNYVFNMNVSSTVRRMLSALHCYPQLWFSVLAVPSTSSFPYFHFFCRNL